MHLITFCFVGSYYYYLLPVLLFVIKILVVLCVVKYVGIKIRYV